MCADVCFIWTVIITVAYKCCASHSVFMTSPLITAPADSSHSSLATAPAVGAVLWTSTAVGAVFIYTQGNVLELGTRQM